MPDKRSQARPAVVFDDAEFDKRLAEFTARKFGKIGEPQLRVDMTRLREFLGIKSAETFKAKYGFSRNRIADLADDRWSDLSRRQLRVLHNLEREVQANAAKLESPALREEAAKFRVMESVPDRIWETSALPTIGFFGTDSRPEREALDSAVKYQFVRVGMKLLDPQGVSAVDAMRGSNCIFFGSPKYNPSTKDALAALWPTGLPKVSFSWPEPQAESSKSKIDGRGLAYVDHEGKPQFEEDQCSGVFIICRRPPGSSSDVTTMICAGSSKFGTLQVVEDVLAGEVYVWSTQLKFGRSDVFVLRSHSQNQHWYNIEGERYRAVKRSQPKNQTRED